MEAGAISNPLAVCEKVPFSVALEHPLLSAFAAGVTTRANAVTATIARVFAVVVRFIIISFCVHELTGKPDLSGPERQHNRPAGVLSIAAA
jgi:hypothetical protein